MSDLTLLVSLSNIGLRMISEKKLAQELQAMMQRLANQELLLQSVVSNTMDSLGNQEVRNAQEALRDALISSSPRHELTSAINHLQSAATHFEEKAARVHFGKEGYPPKYTVSAEALSKTANCYAVIATIYAGLKERDLTAKYASLCKVCFLLSLNDKKDRNSSKKEFPEKDLLGLFGFLQTLLAVLPDPPQTYGDLGAMGTIVVFPGLFEDNHPMMADFNKLLESKVKSLYPA
jgi:hypothetical protein